MFGELESPLDQFWGPNKGGSALPVTALELWFNYGERKTEGKANHGRAVVPMARGASRDGEDCSVHSKRFLRPIGEACLQNIRWFKETN